MLLTDEWNSKSERERAAEAMLALPGGERTARVLRARRSRDLSKTCLISLCRLWGYKSEWWQPSGDLRRRRRKAPTAAAVAPASLALVPVPHLPLPSVCAFDAGSLSSFVAVQLMPLLWASSAAFEGPRSRVCTLSGGQAPFTIASLDAYVAMRQLGAARHASWAASAAKQRDWAAPALLHARSGFAGADTAAAWQLIPYCAENGSAVGHLQELAEILKAGMRMLSANSSTVLLGSATLEPPACFSVALGEFSSALRDGSAFHAAATLLLAQLSAAASLDAYVVGAEAVLVAAATYIADTSAAFERRRLWSSEALQARAVTPLAKRETGWVDFFGSQLEGASGRDGAGAPDIVSGASAERLQRPDRAAPATA